MMARNYVYCPYCGAIQTDEGGLLRLMENEVFALLCTECDKSCVLVLYEGARGSEGTAK